MTFRPGHVRLAEFSDHVRTIERELAALLALKDDEPKGIAPTDTWLAYGRRVKEAYGDAPAMRAREDALRLEARMLGLTELSGFDLDRWCRGQELSASGLRNAHAAAVREACVDAGADLAELVRTVLKSERSIAGYGRPIASGDERIAPMMALVREQSLDGGEHLRLAFEVERILLAGRWRLHMNYGALVAALGADFGLSPQEYYLFMIPAFLAGMPPCYLEAAEKPEGLLFPLPCRVMLYEGAAHRPWRGATPKT